MRILLFLFLFAGLSSKAQEESQFILIEPIEEFLQEDTIRLIAQLPFGEVRSIKIQKVNSYVGERSALFVGHAPIFCCCCHLSWNAGQHFQEIWNPGYLLPLEPAVFLDSNSGQKQIADFRYEPSLLLKKANRSD